jgi:hypothetical protein
VATYGYVARMRWTRARLSSRSGSGLYGATRRGAQWVHEVVRQNADGAEVDHTPGRAAVGSPVRSAYEDLASH